MYVVTGSCEWRGVGGMHETGVSYQIISSSQVRRCSRWMSVEDDAGMRRTAYTSATSTDTSPGRFGLDQPSKLLLPKSFQTAHHKPYFVRRSSKFRPQHWLNKEQEI